MATYTQQQFSNYLAVVSRFAAQQANGLKTFDAYLSRLTRHYKIESRSEAEAIQGLKLCRDAELVSKAMARICTL